MGTLYPVIGLWIFKHHHNKNILIQHYGYEKNIHIKIQKEKVNLLYLYAGIEQISKR